MFRLRVTEPAKETAIPNAPYHEWLASDGRVVTQFFRVAGGYLLRVRGIADFAVACAGEDIECRPLASVSAASIRHTYINQVLPLALSRLGTLVFHASAVDLSGHAVAFAGEAGRGKSTLAASFATTGHPFLTDDGLVIEQRGADYWVAPSHPSIRLWEDSQKALVHPDTPSAEPLPFTSKTRFLAGYDIPFCGEPRPLRHVYFLGDGTSPRVSFAPMSASEALIELVKHSFLLDIQASDLIAAHFDQLTRLVGRRIYYRLDYPRRFEALGEVRSAILSHCGL